VLHATYQRLFTQPIDDYTFLLKDEQYMSNAPDAMRGLLGAEIFFSSANGRRWAGWREANEVSAHGQTIAETILVVEYGR